MRVAPFVALGAVLAMVAIAVVRLLGGGAEVFPTSAATLPPRVEPAARTGAAADDQAAALPLRPDGLGDLPFGTPADAALEQLTARLGPPDGQADLFCEADATVPVAELTEWTDLGVIVWDGQLRGWMLSEAGGASLDLRTDAGIGLGSSVNELRERYGDQLTVRPVEPVDQALGDLHFTIGPTDPATGHGLSGHVTGDERTGTVNGLLGGPGPCRERP